MSLIDDWRKELNRLWSVRLIVLSVVLLNAPDAIPLLQDYISPTWFKMLSTLAGLGAFLARFVKQNDSTGTP